MFDKISYIVNHLFLPPILPQTDDRDVECRKALLLHVAESADVFCQHLERSGVDPTVHRCWRILYKMLLSIQTIRQDAFIDQQELEIAVQNMEVDDIICLHITKQNAGIVLRRLKTEISLEFFQASPTAAVVTGTNGKLIMQFPSRPRLSVPNDPRLIKSFCAYLVAMDNTEMPDAVPKTEKGQATQKEYRDVPDIRYIAELLGGIARALTSDVNAMASSTVYVTKRVNDHVLYKSAECPWRRDPQWLVLRVALQTTLSQWKVDERYGYKSFITFVLARVLERALKADLSLELLYIMNVKIATRIWKLRSLVHVEFPFKYIRDISRSCRQYLDHQWNMVKDLEATPQRWTAPTMDDIHKAQGFALTSSREYLSAVYNRSSQLERQNSSFSPEEFEATLTRNYLRTKGVSPPTPIDGAVTGIDLWLAILDVEHWTENELEEWMVKTHPERRLEVLKAMITRHDSIALSSGNPEQFSRVFLVILELWVALDKTVIEAIPLLKEYSPELSVSSFEPLLLPMLSQMKRLRAVEEYIQSRHDGVSPLYGSFSLFRFIPHEDSFAARYFRYDNQLQKSRSTIKSEATEMRTKKIQECQRRNKEYRRRKNVNDRQTCDYIEYLDRRGYERSRHTNKCQKCSEERELNDMRITVFEWPLPADDILSRLVVFELQVPKLVGVWRDITYNLARHYSSHTPGQKSAPTPVLSEYPALKKYISFVDGQCISVASTTKSFLAAHYRECRFPCDQDDVVKPNGLLFSLYDVVRCEWIANEFPNLAIRKMCTPDFRSGPYESLAWAGSGTAHTSNKVLARQSNCPSTLSYHEWEAFGHIRSGHRLQWRNMMLELTNGTVVLKDSTVHLLFRQAAWQVEKRTNTDYREAHIDPADELFGIDAVGVLRGRLGRIRDNWQEGWTAATLSILACRLFSLSSSVIVQESIREFLSDLRLTVWKWLDQVVHLQNGQDTRLGIDDGSTENPVNDMRSRVIQLAATCRSTFALELDEVHRLFDDPQFLSIFMKCAIVLQNNTPGNITSLPTHLRYLVERDMVLSVDVIDLLVKAVLRDNAGMEDAIRYVWQGFRRDPLLPWKRVGDRWTACQTDSQGSTDESRHVIINLLDGTVLVDGKTISNLPKKILQHSLFQAVFPNHFTMHIVPSTMKGMEYQSSINVKDRLEIHFVMQGTDLLIRTRDIHFHDLSEFVPSGKLQGDVPNAILLGTLHIFHESSQSLHVYPASSGWNPSALPDWIMRFAADPKLATGINYPTLTTARSEGVDDSILSPESPLLRTLSTIFQPLEASITNILVTWEPSQGTTASSLYSSGHLIVFLPRYKLKFFVGAKGDLECKELPGMFVSRKQSIGTLHGLTNKLVLDPKDTNTVRKLILPDGNITVSLRSPHQKVRILPCQDVGQQIRMFVYDVDELIGRLVGDGTVTNWYFLAYLHAVTSSHLLDPLIHRTGVQQTLAMLKSANAFAFTQLAPQDIRLLQSIHRLTPVRLYYPKHLHSMEQVNWNSALSFLSQSELFVPFVEKIVGYRNNQILFYSTPTPLILKYEGIPALRSRAELRNCRFVTSEVHEAVSPHDYCFWPARCLQQSSVESVEQERIVVETASLVANWTSHRQVSLNIWEQFRAWNVFSTEVDSHISFDNPNAWFSKRPNEIWFSLFSLCVNVSKERDVFGLMFALGIASYRSDIDNRMVYAMCAIATNSPSASLRDAASLFPQASMFILSPGHTLELQEVKRIAEEHRLSFESSLQAGLPRYSLETEIEAADRRWRDYCSQRDAQCQSLAEYIFQQWPGSVAAVPLLFSTDYSLIHELPFKDVISELFRSRFLNRCLFQHSEKLQVAFDQIPHRAPVATIAMVPNIPEVGTPFPNYVPIALWGLVRSNDRLVSSPQAAASSLDKSSYGSKQTSPIEPVLVRNICTRRSSTQELVLRLSERNYGGLSDRYITDLRQCVEALETRSELSVEHLRYPHMSQTSPRSDVLSTPSVWEDAQTALNPRTFPEEVVSYAGLWPCSGPESLISLLSLHHRREVHDDWKAVLTGCVEGLAAIQRKRRIAAFEYLGLQSERAKETSNHGGQGWEALKYPDWLLIQLDANLLIRPVQASIAHKMMSPKSEQNTVMQLNMGEGKSSVIVPIISTAMADGKQLVRVIVLKPLCAQMFHLLKQRICGLANRRLYYLPFSRSVSLDVKMIGIIYNMFKACARDGGVLLCQPEHILSFQLMGLHLLCNTGDITNAAPYLEAQWWLDANTRDILDESDEILSVRYQLIYTLGAPGPLQCQPDRWQIIQNVFSLIKDHLKEVAITHPDGLELQPVDTHSSYFPRTRILTHKCGQYLLRSIAHQIVFKEKLPSIPFRSYSSTSRKLAFRFLTEIGITQADSNKLQKYSDEYFNHLLLLRGLIADGILLHSLKEKRWRVEYGLDPSRSMLAVPYRAKDCPAPRAEFGHPDMLIVLTCLSYYYGGLSNPQLESTFHQLYNSDDPSSRYEDWIKGSLPDIPETLRSLRSLNLDDHDQKYHQVFPHLRDNKAVIDFYLSECVFPKEAKTFQYKLTTNSWDLARTKTKLTTGFSGTNDNRYLLPLSIEQLDSDDQRHTNAQVLEYLLRVENRTVVHIGSDVTALGLIGEVIKQEPHVTVLLDVGAQVLELENKAVAQEWLKRDKHPTVEAAVYCDSKNDEFYVLRRDGHVEPLQRSLYKTQLDKTLVYLDEARTRGTDFKFPASTRAAVMLGPKLCKDKLVQGCMRMRRLGSDHSVLFFASSEIWGKIQASTGNYGNELNSSDVLIWTIHETWEQLKDNGAHWTSQGLNFDIRRTAWDKYSMGCLSPSGLADILREKESRTLHELYGVKENDSLFEWSVGEDAPSERQKSIQAKCHEFGITLSRSSALLEEQERELAHEKEEERQVERVTASSPLKHAIDPALFQFIQSGTTSASFISLVDCLEGTSQGSLLLTLSKSFFQSTNLRATKDFSRTIVGGHVPGSMDDFLRPVRWILRSNIRSDMLLLISPFEANELLPEIRGSSAHLHLYSPRVSRQLACLDDMRFFPVPSLRNFTPPLSRTIQELNLFGGQLFFGDKSSFKEVCQMLGLHLGEIPDEVKGKVDSTGFVRDETARQILDLQTCLFRENGVPFLRELIRLRRKGHGFILTHIGDILHGNDLRESEFE